MLYKNQNIWECSANFLVKLHLKIREIEDLFIQITGEELPASAIIIEKEGDYALLDHYISAIIQMDTTDFNKIYARVATDSIYDFSLPDTIYRKLATGRTTWTIHTERIKLLRKAQISNTGFEIYKLDYKEISFSSDNHHIIIKHED